jgi:hypothetical protein
MKPEQLREGWLRARRTSTRRHRWQRYTVRWQSSWLQTFGFRPLNLMQRRPAQHRRRSQKSPPAMMRHATRIASIGIAIGAVGRWTPGVRRCDSRAAVARAPGQPPRATAPALSRTRHWFACAASVVHAARDWRPSARLPERHAPGGGPPTAALQVRHVARRALVGPGAGGRSASECAAGGGTPARSRSPSATDSSTTTSTTLLPTWVSAAPACGGSCAGDVCQAGQTIQTAPTRFASAWRRVARRHERLRLRGVPRVRAARRC